eukprot:TRINITY_DN10567_c0_g1_i1.p1 TRINITY_DN10567_c0_g1~~TRINITY_DN10567_c0_g1_i1.p1  ORF type:complete len:170 (+),score=21.47 TRINITY_DN10567_c0_g1_i1:34-543(+)
MGQQSVKKIIKANKKWLDDCFYFMSGICAIYILYKFVYNWESVTGWGWFTGAIFGFINLYVYMSLKRFARPVTDGDEVISPGIPLDTPGLVEYHWDFLYITWATQLVTMFSNWGWLIFTVIPGYAIYMLFSYVIIPYFGSRGEGEDEGRGSRRKERSEKRNNRSKVARE